MIDSDIPKVEHTRDPFINPLRRHTAVSEEEGEETEPEVVEGDPEPMQRDKMIKMKDLLVLIQQALAAGEEDEARMKFKQFKELYNDLQRGKITKKEYKDQMEETWKVAMETVYPRLRQIELRKFRQEARAGLDKLYDDYKKQDIEAARQHNTELLKVLEPKLKSDDEEFVSEAKKFDRERDELFNRIKILEEFQKNVRPFLKLTATITSKEVNIAMMETIFGGELKKTSLRESDSLPRMESFVLLKIEEDRILARYRGEQVEVILGAGFEVAETP
jgi:hypothetical protein